MHGKVNGLTFLGIVYIIYKITLLHIRVGAGNDLINSQTWLTPGEQIIKCCLKYLSRIANTAYR
jgi:hypothetical protein